MKTQIENIIHIHYKDYGLLKTDLKNQVLNASNAVKKATFFNGSSFDHVWNYTKDKLVKTEILKYPMSRDIGLIFSILSRETGPLNYRFYTNIINGQLNRRYVTSGADVHKDGIAGFDFILSGSQKAFHVKNYESADISYNTVSPSEFKPGKINQRPAKIEVRDFTFSAFSMIAFCNKRMQEEINGFDNLSTQAKRIWTALFFAGSGYAKHMIKTIDSYCENNAITLDYNLICYPNVASTSNWKNTNSRLRNSRRVALKAQVFEEILELDFFTASFLDSMTDFVKGLFKTTETNKGTVTASSLRVRKGPGTNFKTNGKSLPRGTEVTIINKENDWYCIGKERWVYGKYIQLEQPDNSEENKHHSSSQNNPITLKNNVGFSDNYVNRKEDVKSIQHGFNQLGFNIKENGSIQFYYEERNGRKKLKTELGSKGRETITTIYAFQHYFGLTPDGKITPNGETLKKLNEALQKGTKIIRDYKTLSKKSNFPKSTNSKLEGIQHLITDRNDYTVPERYFEDMTELITNLEIIANEIGSIRISNGYRSPEYNATRYKGRAEGSKHMFGIAADLVPTKAKAKTLHTTILKLISDQKIKSGGVGFYGSYVHYDIRGVDARW